MKKLFLIIIFTFLLTPVSVFAFDSSTVSAVQQEKKLHIAALTRFFEKNNSPLKPYTKVFIDEAEKNGLDWKLVPAITGVESSFGKAIPVNSYNAYGWNNGDHYFNNWEDGIMVVTKTLNEKYKQGWGADDPFEIGRYYASSPTWASRVVYFMEQIEKSTADLTLLPLSL